MCYAITQRYTSLISPSCRTVVKASNASKMAPEVPIFICLIISMFTSEENDNCDDCKKNLVAWKTLESSWVISLAFSIGIRFLY